MIEDTKALVSVNELKRLLFTIVEGPFPICMRYRLIGQLWYPNFLQVLKISTEFGVVFHDETRNALLSLTDLSTIMQFELDCPLHSFQPNFHYQVTLNENYKLNDGDTDVRQLRSGGGAI